MKHEELSPAVLSARAITRRHFFRTGGLGFGAIALHSLLSGEGVLAQGVTTQRLSPLAPKPPMFAPKAKRVIYLHMAGSPSQLELFEHKPELEKLHLKDCPPSFLEGKRFAFIKGVPKILAAQVRFNRYGESGQWISELLPNLHKGHRQDMCYSDCPYGSVQSRAGTALRAYGISTSWQCIAGIVGDIRTGEREREPAGFVVLLSGGKTPDAGKSLWGSGFLPSVYQGVQCRTTGDPVLYLGDPAGLDRKLRRRTLDALAEMNNAEYARSGDAETLTRIEQYELAYRMQMSVPEVMDISKEPQHILDLYGAKPGYVSPAESADDPRKLYKGDDPTFANNCLLARRLVENGVRFVQLYDWGWDHHGSSPGESIDETLPIKCQQIDRAITGLLIDLEQRGLLNETLVVWGGEFGRTPMMQNNVRTELKKGYIGRDHHTSAYAMWLAGGGIKGGLAYGATDEFGYYPVENPVSVRDLQATIEHVLGLDPHKFSYPYQGLNNRLIGPSDEGQVLKDILL